MLEAEELKVMAVLVKRFGNEDCTKWLAEEKQFVESIFKTTTTEIVATLREISYDQLLKKILHEIDNLKEQ